MKRISDTSYLLALFGLCIGVPVEIGNAYPMFEDYDPFGLGTIIPLLCTAALFAGLIIPAKFKPNPLNGFKLSVMLAFTGFAFVAMMNDLSENGGSFWAVVYHLVLPAVVWGWQVWTWRRGEVQDDA